MSVPTNKANTLPVGVNDPKWQRSVPAQARHDKGFVSSNGCGTIMTKVFIVRFLTFPLSLDLRVPCYWHDDEYGVGEDFRSDEHKEQADLDFKKNLQMALKAYPENLGRISKFFYELPDRIPNKCPLVLRAVKVSPSVYNRVTPKLKLASSAYKFLIDFTIKSIPDLYCSASKMAGHTAYWR